MEVDIFSQVANGFYAKSLGHIRVEGESGLIQATSSSVPQSSDSSLFPQFSGRGFAALDYSPSENIAVQWVFPSLPISSEYQFSFLYSNQDRRSRRLPVTLLQSGRNHNARVTFLSNCFACTAYLTSSDANQVTEHVNFTLTQSMVTIVLPLSSINISLDVIIAVPRDFFHPVNLEDVARFSSTCDILSGSSKYVKFLIMCTVYKSGLFFQQFFLSSEFSTTFY